MRTNYIYVSIGAPLYHTRGSHFTETKLSFLLATRLPYPIGLNAVRIALNLYARRQNPVRKHEGGGRRHAGERD